jgi:hypothetical protein
MPTYIHIDVNQKGTDNTVPILRQNKFIAYIKALLAPLIKKTGDIEDVYLGGLTYSAYSNVTSYVYGNRVTVANASYECIQANTGIYVTNTDYWYKISNDTIGLTERLNFNCSKMQLEYILNRRFNPAGVTPPYGSAYHNIYIQTFPSLPRMIWAGRNNALTGYVTTKYSSRHYFLGSGNPTLNVKNYIIYIPTSVYTSISPYSTPDAVRMVTKEVNKYNAAGITFGVTHY